MKALIDCYARIIYAIPFAIFGLMHFMKGGDMAGMVPSFIPGGIFWVYLVGLALIAAAVAIIIQKHGRLACLLLALMLLIFILTMHIPMAMEEATRQMAMSSLLKDFGLMGGALLCAGQFES